MAEGYNTGTSFINFGSFSYGESQADLYFTTFGSLLPVPKPTKELYDEYIAEGITDTNPKNLYDLNEYSYIGCFMSMTPSTEISYMHLIQPLVPTLYCGIYKKVGETYYRKPLTPFYGYTEVIKVETKDGETNTYYEYPAIQDNMCYLCAMYPLYGGNTNGLAFISMVKDFKAIKPYPNLKTETKCIPITECEPTKPYHQGDFQWIPFYIYGADGEVIEPSLEPNEENLPKPYPNGAGGGGGGGGRGEDDSVPPLPSLGAGGLGFVNLYNPNSTMLQQLGGYLWSTDILDNIQKIWQDPMDLIVTLNIVPCTPIQSVSKRVYIGGLDTGVVMPVIESEYMTINCGSVYVPTAYNGYMDYNPNTKVQMYVPFVGFVPLNTDEVMGKSLTLSYNINMLTGNAMAFISVTGNGLSNVLYQYSCNVIQTVQLSAKNFSNIIRNAINTGTSSVVGAVAGGGIGGALAGGTVGAINTALTKPEVKRGGENNGGSSFMAHKKLPYIVIERPIQSYADNYNYYEGLPTNITATVGKCTGFIQFESINLNGLKCHKDERDEIEQILKDGIYV